MPLFTGFKFGFGRSASEGVSFTATGGNQSPGDGLEPGNGYKYHVYTTTGAATFQVTEGAADVEILVLGGGGTGAGDPTTFNGGQCGGGAGGIVYHPTLPLTPGTYPMTIGDGGVTARPNPVAPSSWGMDGIPSVFNWSPTANLTGNGGAWGGTPGWYTPRPQAQRGCGPGSSISWPAGYPVEGGQPDMTHPGIPAGWTNYGGDGGDVAGEPNQSEYGGGGGCGGNGQGVLPSTPSANAGKGGAGQPFPQFAYPLVGLAPVEPYALSPTNDHYGGGGGSAMNTDNKQPGDPWVPPPGPTYSSYRWGCGDGGAGGGGGRHNLGKDGTSYPNTIYKDGVDGLGGGGGANPKDFGTGGDGGKGIIIIRYAV